MIQDTLQVSIVNQDNNFFETLLPFIFTVSGIILGFFLGIIRDWWRDYSTFKRTRKYFFYSLFNLNKGVKQQILVYEKQIETLQSNITNFQPMPINLNFTTSFVNVISNNDLYKILVTKGNKKDEFYITDLKILKIGFDKIEGIIKNVENDDKYLRDAYGHCINRFNTLQENLKNQIDNIATGKDEKYARLREDILDLGDKFEKSRTVKEETTIFKVMEDYVLPLTKILNNYNYYSLKLITDEMEYTYNELLTKRSSFVEHLKTDLKDLKETINIHQETVLQRYSKYIDKDLFKVDEIVKRQVNVKQQTPPK